MSYLNLDNNHYEAIRRVLVQSGYATLPPYANYSDDFDYALKDFVLRLYGERLHSFPVRMAELPRTFVQAFGEDPGISQFSHAPQHDAKTRQLIEELLPRMLAARYAEVLGSVLAEKVEDEPLAPDEVEDPLDTSPKETLEVNEAAEQPVTEPDNDAALNPARPKPEPLKMSDEAAAQFEADSAAAEGQQAEPDEEDPPVAPEPAVKEKPAAKVKLKTSKKS
jgi:hypothetical protein